VVWYRKAAAQGHLLSQYFLAAFHATGQGVPKDFVQAHMWFDLAASHGMSDADILRASLAKEMTPEQLAQARQLAQEWKPKRSQ